MTGIYSITNKINNKIYIGQSVNIEQRWKTHRNAAYNKNNPAYNNSLYRAIRKYGLENFSFKVIEECRIDFLDEKECYWIKKYQSNNPVYGYNLTAGGQNGTPSKLTKEQVEEIRGLLIYTILSEEKIAKRYNVSQRLISSINLGECWLHEGMDYPLRKIPVSTCCDCGTKISPHATRCVKCAHKLQQKQKRPLREKLKEQIRNFSFAEIGRYYNVSDNTIRKWCVSMNLPTSKREINNITNEDWLKI